MLAEEIHVEDKTVCFLFYREGLGVGSNKLCLLCTVVGSVYEKQATLSIIRGVDI